MQMASWIGNFLLATCAIPYLLKVLRTRQTSGILFLVTWTVGELLLLGVCISEKRWDFAANYGVNSFCLLIVWMLKLTWILKLKGKANE